MRILGIDFTSAPRPKKPITCAIATLNSNRLRVQELRALPSFEAFEELLAGAGPWVAGFDFPFGQPRPLVEALGWPQPWAAYVRAVELGGKQSFEQALTDYKAARPSGKKEPVRRSDQLARSRSPTKLFNPPVAKMFFQGAPRLLSSGACVLPCHPTTSDRIALEAYPALVARTFIGAASYKSDDLAKQTAARRDARQALVAALVSDALHHHYGISLDLDGALADTFVEDATGDKLDAALCAVQAAWAYSQRAANYGIPHSCDPLEGWIVDPGQLC
ncbi:MAG: DUF429 domain-containing protein [Chloroflexales bacterium]|nr:DUF429 domain-containing protein [Chloroflexales bacterium]